MNWVGGPTQIHDLRFVWWYRLWLWIKFRVFRRKTGFYFAKPQLIVPRKDPCDYTGMVYVYHQKGMKKSKRSNAST